MKPETLVGRCFVWEPLKAHATELSVVVSVSFNADEEWWVETANLKTGVRYWNTLERFNEATTLSGTVVGDLLLQAEVAKQVGEFEAPPEAVTDQESASPLVQEPERFDPDISHGPTDAPCMSKCDDGEFVRYEDYRKLLESMPSPNAANKSAVVWRHLRIVTPPSFNGKRGAIAVDLDTQERHELCYMCGLPQDEHKPKCPKDGMSRTLFV